MVDDREIRREHLEFLVDPSIDMYAKIDNLKEAKALFEKSFIERKLVKYNYNLRELSKAMGIDISNLYRKIKAYNIPLKENLDSN